MKGVIDVRTNEKQKEEIKKIAKIWEDALLNADITDENARINKEIYYGLKANLTFAYIVTEQFEKARKFYNDLIEHNSDLLDMKDAVNDLTTLFSLYQEVTTECIPILI
jgi:predicted transcriptional regulator YdeE